MKRRSITEKAAGGERRGFAVVLTLGLLALMVLLLLGLATFTKIATQVSENTAKQALARRNALMALNIALGRLQKYAGPDTRVTATAEAFDGINGTRHDTGVWDSTTSGRTALTWLVSGSENGTVDPASEPDNPQELVGLGTSGAPNEVVAAKMPIRSADVPGQPGMATIGAYAWWIGDEGVKADVAVADGAGSADYAPFDSSELHRRLGQQIALGAGPANAAGETAFEPRDAKNAPQLPHVISRDQLVWLKTQAGTEAIGNPLTRQTFFDWTQGVEAVIADTARGGLRRDGSIDPSLLGGDYARWASYPEGDVMESIAAPDEPGPSPPYAPDPLRRRYHITASVQDAAGVAPVLTYFYILLGVRKQNASAPYTLGLRWAAALWNPYTSALVPEDLRLEISGLPAAVAIRARPASASPGTGTTDATASLASLYGHPLRVRLPWDAAAAAKADRHSWLPGRTYNWVSTPDAAFVPSRVNPGRFYSRSIPGLTSGLMVSVNGSSAVNGNSYLSLGLDTETTLTIELRRDRDGALLARYTSPTYQTVPTTDEFQASGNTSPVGFVFRLAESFDTIATDPGLWLRTAGQDPRSPDFPPDGLTTSPKSTSPSDCKNYTTISSPERFFDRDITTGSSYDEDVPLFELPRSPVLSLGELQHLYVAGARTFAIGNSWGEQAQINGFRGNEIFDRFFLSGLTGAVAENFIPGHALPNPLLRMRSVKPDGSAVTTGDLTGAEGQRSSKYLLQTGAFNVNSVSLLAWMAVLRAGRFLPDEDFVYLDPESATGTASDTNTASLQPAGAVFLRFSQTAQEVYRANDAYAQTTTNAGGGGGPIINVPLFRRGLRALAPAQVQALASAIVALVKRKLADSGPFRSVEEFLNPSPLFHGEDDAGEPVSLLEKAIELARLNSKAALNLSATDPEFSSQWLTQGDMVAMLAPLLYVRSDTFRIRAYGETDNPVTADKEAAAWCEAVVQRLPEPLAAANPASPTDGEYQRPPGEYGRKFKLIAFRWLTNTDI